MGAAFDRAQVLYNQQRYSQAQEEFERDLAENPRRSGTVAMIAMCLTNLNRIPEARATAEQAIALDPENGFAHYALAWAIYKDEKFVTNRGIKWGWNKQDLLVRRYKQVENALLDALRLQPRNPGYHSLLAFTRLARGNRQGALDAANDCLAIDPNHSEGHRAAALALARLGQVTQANKASANAVAARPLGPETHLTRAVTLLRHGNAAEALTHCREAVRLDPNDLPARRTLLECLRMQWLFYRLRARINLAGRPVSVAFYFASLIAMNVGSTNLDPARSDTFRWLILILAGGLLFAWLNSARGLADLLLLRNPLARQMLSTPSKWLCWPIAAGVITVVICGVGILTLTLQRRDASVFFNVGLDALFLLWILRILLISADNRAAKKQ